MSIQIGGYYNCGKCGERYHSSNVHICEPNEDKGFETNITCEECQHDMLYCTCSEEYKEARTKEAIKEIEALIFKEPEKNEVCDVCGDELDGYGCMGVISGRHTAAVFKLAEAALTAGIEALGDLKNYCAQNGYVIPRELHNSTSKACILMQNCVGKKGFDESKGGVSFTFDYDDRMDVNFAIDAVQSALQWSEVPGNRKNRYIIGTLPKACLVTTDEDHLHFSVRYAKEQDFEEQTND